MRLHGVRTVTRSGITVEGARVGGIRRHAMSADDNARGAPARMRPGGLGAGRRHGGPCMADVPRSPAGVAAGPARRHEPAWCPGRVSPHFKRVSFLTDLTPLTLRATCTAGGANLRVNSIMHFPLSAALRRQSTGLRATDYDVHDCDQRYDVDRPAGRGRRACAENIDQHQSRLFAGVHSGARATAVDSPTQLRNRRAANASRTRGVRRAPHRLASPRAASNRRAEDRSACWLPPLPGQRDKIGALPNRQ